MGSAILVMVLATAVLAVVMVVYGLRPKALASKTEATAIDGPRKHKHQWRYHSSHFNEPGQALTSVKNVSEEHLLTLLHGFTNVTYTCTVDECTEVRIETVPGKVSDPYQGKEYKP